MDEGSVPAWASFDGQVTWGERRVLSCQQQHGCERLFNLPGAAVQKPDGTVHEVLLSLAGKQTLCATN